MDPVDRYIKDTNLKYTSGRYCAPKVKYEGTCFSKEALVAMLQSKGIDTKNKTKKEMWTILQKEVGKECNTEYCWLKLPFTSKELGTEMYNEIHNQTFLPKIPKTKYEWLDTYDIEKVLRQYEQVDPSFMLLGVWPIDFATAYKNADINKPLTLFYDRCKHKEMQCKRKFGAVFNIDPSDKPGQHWVAMYIDTRKGHESIDYWDSYGVRPQKEIREYIKKLKATDILKNAIVNINKKRHQYGGSECGVYSIHFIIKRMNDQSFDSVVNNVIKDKEMNKNRIKYFRPRIDSVL